MSAVWWCLHCEGEDREPGGMTGLGGGQSKVRETVFRTQTMYPNFNIGRPTRFNKELFENAPPYMIIRQNLYHIHLHLFTNPCKLEDKYE